VQLLAAAIDPRYRAFVLLAVFGSLRWGELMGLRRSDFDLEAGLVRIERAVSEIGAKQIIKKPKTAAGVRTVALPWWLIPELRRHFDIYAEQGQDGRVFVGPKGATPLRPNFSSVWARALAGAGLAGIHIHGLRHTGNHFVAMTGASTRELMGRMGHASMDAALIYQPRTADRDRAIADAIDLMLTRFDELPETPVAAGTSESSSDGHGHGRARVPISDANGRRIQREMASDYIALQRFSCVERVTGIEPALSAWDLFELRGFVLGSWRVSRSRAAWSVPWMPTVMAR
jgi:hypothetical protein